MVKYNFILLAIQPVRNFVQVKNVANLASYKIHLEREETSDESCVKI